MNFVKMLSSLLMQYLFDNFKEYPPAILGLIQHLNWELWKWKELVVSDQWLCIESFEQVTCFAVRYFWKYWNNIAVPTNLIFGSLDSFFCGQIQKFAGDTIMKKVIQVKNSDRLYYLKKNAFKALIKPTIANHSKFIDPFRPVHFRKFQ